MIKVVCSKCTLRNKLFHLGEDVFSFNFGPESPPLTALIASVLRRYSDGGIEIMKVRKLTGCLFSSRD